MLEQTKQTNFGVKYDDERFPPGNSSLFGNSDEIEQWSKFEWKRLSDKEYFSTNTNSVLFINNKDELKYNFMD